MLGRLYVWLVCHNLCPCAVFWRVPVVGGWVAYYCGHVLDRRYLGDDDVRYALAAEAGAAMVDELAEDLRHLADS